MIERFNLAGLLMIACAACASVPKPMAAVPAGSATAAPVAFPDVPPRPAAVASCDSAKDRAAILSMAGTFAISFAFDETEALTPGYKLAEPYRTDATEVVTVLESSERRVVLQHVLLIEKHDGSHEAQKHWRQDWTFEDHDLLEFRGARTFAHRTLTDAEAHCTWTQAVFEVDDGPRYESYGAFAHDGERATWVSAETWRPLPRREYTHRSDYDVVLGTNGHVITPSGWQHIQDNVKLVLKDGSKLARERGLNVYERVDEPAAQLAQQYLAQTGTFWAEVREAWAAQVERAPQLLIHQEIAGKPLYEHLFPLAEKSAGTDERAKVRELVASYVEVPPQPSASASHAARE